MTLQPLADLIDPGWADALEPVAGTIATLGEFLRAEVAEGRGYLPAGENILRAFTYPLADVRVLIVGQDPYPSLGHPIGLSFAVDRAVRPVPRSLHNIYKELRSDVGVEPPPHGDLSAWSEQGVMLLNRVLTVQPGRSGSHRRKGWETVTATAIHALVERGGPLVAILWGKDAIALEPMLGSVPVVKSVHPSPLSAGGGFFGSHPFSRTNALLEAQGAVPIDWSIPA
ncbi:MAG: uracil-DNA glycosylase [Microbacteriaceae bacterium]|nr:uracil-DNA glycosylase [Microbacteriaceae bacterium]